MPEPDDDEAPALVIDTRSSTTPRPVGGGLDGPDHTHRGSGRPRPKLRPSRDVGR